jgi:hypothetical protein
MGCATSQKVGGVYESYFCFSDNRHLKRTLERGRKMKIEYFYIDIISAIIVILLCSGSYVVFTQTHIA